MELTNVQIEIPKEMTIYVKNRNPEIELQRNALILYPYIKNMTISHGRAAEILGIKKWELITLYNSLGLSYLDMDITEVEDEVQTFMELEGAMA